MDSCDSTGRSYDCGAAIEQRAAQLPVLLH